MITMPMIRVRLRAVIVASLWLVCIDIHAHDLWLHAESYRGDERSTFGLSLAVRDEDHVKRIPFSRIEVERLALAHPLLSEVEMDTPSDTLRFRLAASGTTSVLVTGKPREIAHDREQWVQYLAELQMPEQEPPALPVQERYSRSLKALLRVGSDAPLRDCLASLPLELQLLEKEKDQPLSIRALFRSQPVVGLSLRLLDQDGVMVGQALTDSYGIGKFSLGAGRWTVAATYLRPADPIRYRSWWTATSFELSGERPEIETCGARPAQT